VGNSCRRSLISLANKTPSDSLDISGVRPREAGIRRTVGKNQPVPTDRADRGMHPLASTPPPSPRPQKRCGQSKAVCLASVSDRAVAPRTSPAGDRPARDHERTPTGQLAGPSRHCAVRDRSPDRVESQNGRPVRPFGYDSSAPDPDVTHSWLDGRNGPSEPGSSPGYVTTWRAPKPRTAPGESGMERTRDQGNSPRCAWAFALRSMAMA
jgi:hypothetical protein